MNRNRYLLCLLICGVMLYYAVPRLSIFSEGLKGLFAIIWLFFALFVIAGNLTALLYNPNNKKKKIVQHNEKKHVRSYHSS